MVPSLISLLILSLFVVVSSRRRDRRLLAKARSALQVRSAERTNELEKANEDLKRAQAELQRRWQYLAEAQRLSHSGTFAWKVSSGELVWSDETYRTLGDLTISLSLNLEAHLLISISDTGEGLPVENIERIFDAFHTTKPEGTGMGLAITRSILESYGGRIWATANQAAGATFHFTLPIEAEARA